MKKSIVIILTGMMTLSLTGCGPDMARIKALTEAVEEAVVEEIGNGDKNEGSKENGEEGGSSETADNAATADGDDFYRTSNGSPLYMTVKKYFYETANDENYTRLYEGHNESLMLVDSEKAKYPELDKRLTSLYKDQLALMEENCKTGIEGAKSDLENGYLNGNYSDTYDLSMQRSDSRVVSYYYNNYNYMNGAHGSYRIIPYTIDVESGKELALTDVISIDNDRLHEKLIEKIKESAKEKDLNPDEVFWDLEDTLSHYSSDVTELQNADGDNYENPYIWYLSDDGIHFYFGIYEIAAYAYGATDVSIGYDEMPEIFDSKYLSDDSDKAFIKDIGMPYESLIDINGDGNKELVTAEYEYDGDNYEYANSVTLKVDDASATIKDVLIDTNSNYTKYYHVRTKDKKNYLYITTAEVNDYYCLYLFDLNDGVKLVSNPEGYAYSFTLAYVENSASEESGEICMTDPDSFYLGSRYDLIGSFSAVGRFHVGADGYPEQDSDSYVVTGFIDSPVHSKEDITADIVDENGNVISEGETIGKGEQFTPFVLHRDGSGYSLDTRLSDGRIARLKYSTADYPAKIDGKDINDLFDGMQFAG